MKFCIALIATLFSLSAFAQADSLQPPYKRFPTLPPIQILLSDSTTKYTKDNVPKDKPVFVMLFSPDCSHCQHTAEEMYKYKDELQNIHIVMATMQPFGEMKEFITKYHLNEMPNVVVGKDIYYLIAPFYGVRNLPFMAFYDKKGDLLSVFEGGLPIPKVIELFKGK